MEFIIEFLRNSKKNRITIWSSYPIPGCIHKESTRNLSQHMVKILEQPCLLLYICNSLGLEPAQTFNQQRNKITHTYIHTYTRTHPEILDSQKIEIYRKTETVINHYANLNKSVSKRQIPHVLYMENTNLSYIYVKKLNST